MSVPPRCGVKAAGVCETFQLGVAVHSSGELGIQLATMLHLGAVLPNLTFSADAHYHHLTDDVIEGGLMPYENGAIAVPTKPGRHHFRPPLSPAPTLSPASPSPASTTPGPTKPRPPTRLPIPVTAAPPARGRERSLPAYRA